MSQPHPFRAEPVLAGLTGFQRNTVEHVMDRFYGPDPTDRFLVADETGLGKTIVARGVIARTIEELQHNDAVDRIDIVYICSNQDLAQQNLAKLAVTGDRHHGIASRLTLLAKHFGQLTPQGADHALKPVNLISFTPGTSFSASWQSGKAEERAMLYLLLEAPMGLDRDDRRAANACRVLQGSVGTPERFRSHHVERLRSQLTHGIEPRIAEAFLASAGRTAPTGELATGADLLAEFETQVETIDRQTTDRQDISWHRTWRLVGNLRAVLARESVGLLTPDLVILDEFQRFRDLLDKGTEAGELAHHLFGYHDPATGHRAKALLLSATPFKAFTYAEEEQAGESSYRDFLQIVGFLANGEESGTTARIAGALRDYREAIVTGGAAADLTERVRRELLRVMARTERPRTRATSMTVEISQTLRTPPQEDLLGYVAMKDLARAVDAPISLDYWKSAPYFVNFMDGYKIAGRVRSALEDPKQAGDVRAALERTQRIDFAAKEAYEPIEPGNARLRVLAEETVGRGWWKLLWVPPSLAYLTPGGPYAEDYARQMTKRLVFSSWTATPSSVASLLSYEADRLGAGQEFVGTTSEERDRLGRTRRSRLAYRLDREGERERPSSMSTLAIFWPMPGLAALSDPRNPDLHRGDASGDLDPAALHAHVVARLRTEHPPEHPPEQPGVPAAEPGESAGPAASHWYEALRRPDA